MTKSSRTSGAKHLELHTRVTTETLTTAPHSSIRRVHLQPFLPVFVCVFLLKYISRKIKDEGILGRRGQGVLKMYKRGKRTGQVVISVLLESDRGRRTAGSDVHRFVIIVSRRSSSPEPSVVSPLLRRTASGRRRS